MTLRDIIHENGDKSYYIDVLTYFKETNRARKLHEALVGRCRYDAATGNLTSLDSIEFSLDDDFAKWEQEVIDDEVSLNVYYKDIWVQFR